MPRDGIGREIYSKQQQKNVTRTQNEFEIKAHNGENNKY